MSYADVVSQMQAIQTRLAQLGMLRRPATPASASSSHAASFATALDGATGDRRGATTRLDHRASDRRHR